MVRLRRSVLYVPAANPRAMARAATLPADAVIIDLEDAVAPGAKDDARAAACAAVRGRGFGRREVAVRVNGAGTPWHDDDLRAVCDAGPDVVVVPKISSAADVHRVAAVLAADGAPPGTMIWAMVETARAVLRAEAIATASSRLAALVVGTNDLAAQLRAGHVPGREPLLPALGHCVLAARAAGVAVLDGVHNDLGDAAGFEAECHQARRMGFDGKTLVHPGQIGPCNRVFAPTPDEVQEARALLGAWEDAQAAGAGVVTFRGRMVENLHAEEARRVLATAGAIEKSEN